MIVRQLQKVLNQMLKDNEITIDSEISIVSKTYNENGILIGSDDFEVEDINIGTDFDLIPILQFEFIDKLTNFKRKI